MQHRPLLLKARKKTRALVVNGTAPLPLGEFAGI